MHIHNTPNPLVRGLGYSIAVFFYLELLRQKCTTHTTKWLIMDFAIQAQQHELKNRLEEIHGYTVEVERSSRPYTQKKLFLYSELIFTHIKLVRATISHATKFLC